MEPDTVLSQVTQAVAQAQTIDCRNMSGNEQFLCVARSWRVTIVENLPNLSIALIVLAVALFLDDRVQGAVKRVVGLRNGQRELGG